LLLHIINKNVPLCFHFWANQQVLWEAEVQLTHISVYLFITLINLITFKNLELYTATSVHRIIYLHHLHHLYVYATCITVTSPVCVFHIHHLHHLYVYATCITVTSPVCVFHIHHFHMCLPHISPLSTVRRDVMRYIHELQIV